MPVNSKEKQKKLSDDWYKRNRESHIANTAKNKRRYREAWTAYKTGLQCEHCGFSHPAVIDFHHVIRDKEKESVNYLISRGRYAAAREEIKKCIPLCANCHRILHWDENKVRQAASKKNQSQKKTQSLPSHTFDALPLSSMRDLPDYEDGHLEHQKPPMPPPSE